MMFIAVLYSGEYVYSKTVSLLKEKFGEVIIESKPYEFSFTDYYNKEMGIGLVKRFIVFKKEISKEELAEIRKKTGEIEDKFRVDGKRKINLDPGYINKKEVVLASVKRSDFKEELGNDIFAHRIYSFEDDKVKTFFHTFPDYKVKENIEFFLKIKDKFL